MGAVADTPVGDGARIGGQLHRRDDRVALPDGGLHFQRIRVVGVALGGQTPLRLADLHTGLLPQPQFVGIGVIDIAGQAAAYIVEEDVAAPLDGGHHVDVAAVSVAGTLGMVILEVIVYAIAEDRGIPVDEAGVEGGNGHRGLVGRAGRILPQQRTVEEGQVGIFAVLGIICSVQILLKRKTEK